MITSDFTYTPGTVLGTVRMLSSDTDQLNPISLDSELAVVLLMTGYNGLGSDVVDSSSDFSTILLAAANAIGLMSMSAAKLAVIEKIAVISENTYVTWEALSAQEVKLRSLAAQNILPAIGGSVIINGIAINPNADPFYNTQWLKITNVGDGITNPTSNMDTW